MDLFSAHTNSPGSSQPLTLFQLHQQLRQSIENAFPKTYWVIAEIAELRLHSSGHCYLTLTEKDPGRGSALVAQARGTIWKQNYREIRPYFEAQTGHVLRSGLKILFNACVRFHELYGFNLDILDIDPHYTLGDLARQKNETLQRLAANQLLDRNKAIELAMVPQRLAVISSATAAGYGDFINQLEINPYGYKFRTTLFEASMQGKDAAASIRQALRQAAEQKAAFDALILIRGGGAQTDLLCFDDYALAAEIGAFPLPVLTGIGHERDETVADLVAHTKLKTPTAVAGFLLERCLSFESALYAISDDIRTMASALIKIKHEALENRILALSHSTSRFLSKEDSRMESLFHNLLAKPQKFLATQTMQLCTLELHLINFSRKKLENAELHHQKLHTRACHISRKSIHSASNKLEHTIYQLSAAAKKAVMQQQLRFEILPPRLLASAREFCNRKTYRLELSETRLKALDPAHMLLRGYTLTYANGKLLRSLKALKAGDKLETHFPDGKAHSVFTHSTES